MAVSLPRDFEANTSLELNQRWWACNFRLGTSVGVVMVWDNLHVSTVETTN